MNAKNEVPIGIFHVLEADIPQDAGIVYEDVYPPKCIDSCVDDLVSIDDIIVIGYSVSAELLHLFHDLVGGLNLRSDGCSRDAQ